MRRPPPTLSHTYTLLHYTTLFRSQVRFVVEAEGMASLRLPSAVDAVVDQVEDAIFEGDVARDHPDEEYLRRICLSLVDQFHAPALGRRSEEHTSELQSLMRISYVGCGLNKQHITYLTVHHDI